MKNSETNARNWLLQAENDLSFARVAIREEFFAQACFVSQQVAEKALKALAYYRGDRFPTGHSLVELLSRLEPSYPQLSRYVRVAGILDQYYVPTRYPNALPGSVPFMVYGEEQAQAAVESAAQIVEEARAVIT
ncbi:MAG: HEPN domain-containing protein [Chloroflexi bacterium]|nr:HEPN domain-containing protein [Chloroflexota bacterium]